MLFNFPSVYTIPFNPNINNSNGRHTLTSLPHNPFKQIGNTVGKGKQDMFVKH